MKNPSKCPIICFAPDKKNPQHFQNRFFMFQRAREGERGGGGERERERKQKTKREIKRNRKRKIKIKIKTRLERERLYFLITQAKMKKLRNIEKSDIVCLLQALGIVNYILSR